MGSAFCIIPDYQEIVNISFDPLPVPTTKLCWYFYEKIVLLFTMFQDFSRIVNISFDLHRRKNGKFCTQNHAHCEGVWSLFGNLNFFTNHKTVVLMIRKKFKFPKSDQTPSQWAWFFVKNSPNFLSTPLWRGLTTFWDFIFCYKSLIRPLICQLWWGFDNFLKLSFLQIVNISFDVP